MFDRLTEAARRAMFVSRHNAFLAGSRLIEPLHLLSALFAGHDPGLEALLDRVHLSRSQLVSALPEIPSAPPKGADTRREIPFSDEFKQILAVAQEEADRLSHTRIGSGHLFLALLRAEASAADGLPMNSGGRVEAVRLALAESVTRKNV